MTKVREDDDGVYVVAQNTVWRPANFPITVFSPGEDVKVTATKALDEATVGSDIEDETWVPQCSTDEYKKRLAEAKEWPSWTDFLGNTYKNGDYIIYAMMYGQSASLCFGRVLRINKFDSYGKPLTAYIRRGKVVPSATITVEPIEYSTGGTVRRSRKITIQDPRKVVKIDNSYMEKFEKLDQSLTETAFEKIVEQYK